MRNSDDFERVMELFRGAVVLQRDQRCQYLENIGCRQTRKQVERLLAQDDESSALLPRHMDSQSVDDALGKMALGVAERSPRSVGPYEILETIGMGGMGVVYRARHEGLGRQVALKVLRSTLVSTATLKRFQYEISILSRLQHPYIASFYEAGLHEHLGQTLPYFAMELVEGIELLPYARPLDVSVHIDLLAKIAEGVHHAHQKGVIHRDLKPSNILVDSSGSPRILDFGIARALNADSRVTKTFGEGDSGTGTLAYMSPEQLEPESTDIDIRSDVYALGVFGFEVMTGRLPYARQVTSVASAVRAICDEPRQRARTINPSLPKDVDSILARCLDRTPDQRYQSASELAADLHRLARGEPVMARDPSFLYVTEKFIRRNKLASLAVGAVLVALLAAAWQWKRALDWEKETMQAEVQRLQASDALRAAGLVKQAETLHPTHLSGAGRLREWIKEAEDLLGRVESRKAEAHDLAVNRGVRASDSTWTFRDPDDRRRYLELTSLANSGAILGDRESGALGEAYDRLESLVALETVMEDSRARWEEVLSDLRGDDSWESERLVPRHGLVPLHKNQGGRWEFWHVLSGEKPVANDGSTKPGHWRIHEGMGMVFVLIPPAWAIIGAQSEDEEDPNFDPQANKYEQLDEVDVDPFFISKYEMTQGQWLRSMGTNLAYYKAGADTYDETYPIETVSYEDCVTALGRWGMDLPTPIQWEYAARGGKNTPWWAGGDASDFLEPIGNVQGDVKKSTDPIGSYAENPFGLHDTVGNVFEWTMENFHRTGPEDLVQHYATIRGGSYSSSWNESRVSARLPGRVTLRAPDTGVRPVMRWGGPGQE